MTSPSPSSSSAAPPAPRPLQILNIGLGALGGLYSFILSRSGQCEVTTVARSNYASVSSAGLTIRSQKFGSFPSWRPARVLRMGDAAHEAQARDRYYDYVLCTFKVVEEGERTSEVIRPYLRELSAQGAGAGAGAHPHPHPHPGPTIILIQNGIDIEAEPYAALVACERPLASGVLSGIAWVAANLREGGTVVEHGELESIEVGPYPASSDAPAAATAALDRFVAAYAAGQGTALPKADIQPARWGKVLWNASWGAVSALSRQPVDALLEPASLPYVVGPVRRTMLEVVSVARACGITEGALPAAAVDRALGLTYSQRPANAAQCEFLNPRGFKPSICLDLEAGRPMEVKAIVGNVVQLARRHAVDTPRLDLIMAALRPCQVEAIRRMQPPRDGEGQEDGLPTSEADASTHGTRLPAGFPVGLPW